MKKKKPSSRTTKKTPNQTKTNKPTTTTKQQKKKPTKKHQKPNKSTEDPSILSNKEVLQDNFWLYCCFWLIYCKTSPSCLSPSIKVFCSKITEEYSSVHLCEIMLKMNFIHNLHTLQNLNLF